MQINRGYWNDLYPEFIQSLLPLIIQEIEKENVETKVKTHWSNILKKIALGKFNQIILTFSQTGRNLLKSGQASNKFRRDLYYRLKNFRGKKIIKLKN